MSTSNTQCRGLVILSSLEGVCTQAMQWLLFNFFFSLTSFLGESYRLLLTHCMQHDLMRLEMQLVEQLEVILLVIRL